MRLRTRMLLLVAAALLPAVAVQTFHETEARAAREAAIRAEAMRLTQLVSADLESVFDGARQFLAAAAVLGAFRNPDPATCAKAIAELLRDTPRYLTISATDGAGRITCTAEPGMIGGDVSSRAWFQRARASGGTAIGNYVLGFRSGQPSLHLGLALDQQRHGVAGALSVALDLRWLARRLAEVPLPPGGAVAVADRDGVVLARWPEPERFVGSQLGPQFMARLNAPAPLLVDEPGLDGLRRISAISPLSVRPDGVMVAVGLDPSALEAGLRAANRRGMLLIIGGAALAFGLGLVAARRFLERPVQALVEAMERWRAGDASARAGADPRLAREGPRSEFGRIATAFDDAAAAVAAREAALRASEARLRQIAEAVEDGLYVSQPAQGRFGYVSPGFRRLFGLGPEASSLQDWLAAIHPADRARVAAAIQAAGQAGYALDYRVLRPDGSERLLRDRGVPVEDDTEAATEAATGHGDRVAGVVSDLTEERASAARQTLLAREVDHRAKNVLAVVQSILRLTRAEDSRAFADAVEGRVAALARAHTLLAEGHWSGASLRTLLRQELAPYGEEPFVKQGAACSRQRLELAGPTVRLKPDAVQPLATVIHELATNSARHGALSVAAGRVRIAWEQACPTADGPAQGPSDLTLHWIESDGPPVPEAPRQRGFGARVIAATVEVQLGGKVCFEWTPGGLRCTLLIGADRLLPPRSEDVEAADAPPGVGLAESERPAA